MPAIAWTTIRNAIATWIMSATGLGPERIRWADLNYPEPPLSSTQPWFLIGRFSWTNPGSDWSTFASNPFVFADKTVTLGAVSNTGTSTSHGLLTRDGPVRLRTTGSLSGTGLFEDTDYWIINVNANEVKFATTFADADDGVFVDITGAGTGTHTIVDTADTRRAGQELKEYVRGARRITFDIQCFPPTLSIGVAFPDDYDPIVVLSDIVAKSGLGSISTALQAAGVGVLDPGEPRAIAGPLNSAYFEPRAIMTVVLSATSEVEGTETIIDYINLDEDPGSRDFEIDLTDESGEGLPLPLGGG